MTNKIKRVCVFCGSSFGKNDAYREKVQELGKYLVSKDIELVYGGGNVGLMGELARTVLENGGRAIGVIPKKIYEKVEHIELTELHIVDGMHERKAKMYELADGFIALPGGIGTIEELSEVFTWYQLGYHKKPIGILNINNFYELFNAFLDHMVEEGFIKEKHRNVMLIDEAPDKLIEKMLSHEIVSMDKWVK